MYYTNSQERSGLASVSRTINCIARSQYQDDNRSPSYYSRTTSYSSPSYSSPSSKRYGGGSSSSTYRPSTENWRISVNPVFRQSDWEEILRQNDLCAKAKARGVLEARIPDDEKQFLPRTEVSKDREYPHVWYLSRLEEGDYEDVAVRRGQAEKMNETSRLEYEAEFVERKKLKPYYEMLRLEVGLECSDPISTESMSYHAKQLKQLLDEVENGPDGEMLKRIKEFLSTDVQDNPDPRVWIKDAKEVLALGPARAQVDADSWIISAVERRRVLAEEKEVEDNRYYRLYYREKAMNEDEGCGFVQPCTAFGCGPILEPLWKKQREFI